MSMKHKCCHARAWHKKQQPSKAWPRSLARAVAHNQMELAGIQHINKPRFTFEGKRAPSIFATHWMDYAKSLSAKAYNNQRLSAEYKRLATSKIVRKGRLHG